MAGSLLRILHVINSLVRGGVETQLLRILRDYDRSRFHIDVCCIGANEGFLADEARSYGAEILMCPKSVNLFSFSRRFDRLLTGRGYDIIHSCFETWSGPVLRGAHSAGVPVRIAHMRSCLAGGFSAGGRPLAKAGLGILARWGRRWISRYGTHVLGVSAASLDARWPGWQDRPDRYAVWTGGVDIDLFAPRPEQHSTREPKTVLCVSSLLPVKNHKVLIDVFASVGRSRPGALLRLVGVGPAEPALRRAVATYGLEDRVEFLGLRDDIPELLREADVFLSCSKVEGLPNVLLEAQAAGVPVVASDIPPHREALASELHPYLFPLDDPSAARDAVLRVLTDDELGRRLGEEGRHFVAERFDTRKALDRLEEMYLHWVETKGGPKAG